jgi:rubrerythrin
MIFGFCDRCNPKDKVYVQMDELNFDANGIWFKDPVDALVVGARAIYVDSLGYYVSKSEQIWKCPHCGHANTQHVAWGCAKCGWPYDYSH